MPVSGSAGRNETLGSGGVSILSNHDLWMLYHRAGLCRESDDAEAPRPAGFLESFCQSSNGVLMNSERGDRKEPEVMKGRMSGITLPTFVLSVIKGTKGLCLSLL